MFWEAVPSERSVCNASAPTTRTARTRGSWARSRRARSGTARYLPPLPCRHFRAQEDCPGAAFASDALSSTAYATQEILLVLALAGTAAFHHVFPISVAIVILLAIVTISYEQTIHAYPGGGGAYIVARDNLGELPAQIAGAALLTDYILTVSVSVSSGVAQLASSYPALFGYRVALSLTLVIPIMATNLRGVKESGRIFAVPTYFFVFAMFVTLGIASFRYATGTLGRVVDPPPLEVHRQQAAVTLFLL